MHAFIACYILKNTEYIVLLVLLDIISILISYIVCTELVNYYWQ